MSKPGRNDPCPCGSGRKYKKCHGGIAALDMLSRLNNPRTRQELQTIVASHEAKEFQRREQQGLGKSIISTEFQDYRFVAVGRTLHYSKKWKTFHDFLKEYLKMVFGKDWWMSEVAKPPEERHRILTWAVRSYEQSKAHMDHHGEGTPQPMTGAIAAYMRLAYDLYALKHAVDVQELLIDRIKHPETFPGACYEVRVAAALLRAGFTLELQDETDRRTTHVEFVATNKESGATYSVEAKRREGVRMKINKQMYRALSKRSDHPRIVFIDTNDARLQLGRNQPNPLVLVEAEGLLDRYERDPIGKTLPPAYVIVTFDPEEHHLDAVGLPSGILLWGFHIADLKPGPKTLSQQVEMRRRHAPIFALMGSMQKHRQIPVTFDGEADAYMDTAHQARLKLGQRLDIPGLDGVQVKGTLESGIVIPSRKVAVCVVCTDDQMKLIVDFPLTDEELQAYAQHPATFFGVIDRNAGRPTVRTALDWFNFLWETYSLSSKETLLELMAQAPDIELLKHMSQKDLATEYCTRMAGSMMQHQEAPAHGYQSPRSSEFLEINRRLRQLHPEIVSRTEHAIAELGGHIRRDPKTDLLTLNDELVISLVLARCQTAANGHQRWRIRFDPARFDPDITVAIRLDAANTQELDYYLLPRLDLPDQEIRVGNKNSADFECFRFDDLNFFYGISERERLQRRV